jgi:membrane-bound lytic murein transglycosylase B
MERPRVLVDLYSAGGKNRRNLKNRIDLRNRRVINIPLIFVSKILVSLGVLSYLVFGSAVAPVNQQHSFAAQNQEEREELEKQLQELEAQIDEYQSTVDKYRKEGSGLQSEINSLNAKINQINLQIKSINLSLQRLNGEINVNEEKIQTTENEIQKSKEVLARSLQNIYASENVSIAEILLRRPSLSDFFANISDLVEVQESMRGALEKVIKLKDSLLTEKEILALKRDDAEQLRRYQALQQANILNVKQNKAELLEVTKGNEQKYQELVKETQKTAAEIRKQIFRLFGGGELSFEEAYDLARTAERATGVRAALILAILEQESRLGRNVGQCSPEKSMHPTRDLPKFNQLISELRENNVFVPEPLLVSCAINAHGAYGGAMGPAQFIPSTWLLYKDDIAKVTGNNPPSPWRNADAFVATALYIKNSLNASSCKNYAGQNQNVLPYQFLLERCAAAQYYSGGNWFTFRFVYGDPVLEKADKFQKDINILTS